jgi:hypothetical protein
MDTDMENDYDYRLHMILYVIIIVYQQDFLPYFTY